MDLLERARIRHALSPSIIEQLDSLEVFAETGSTNDMLLRSDAPAPGRCKAALAEYQSAGRGQSNKRWESPPGTGLCLSVSYTFSNAKRHLPCVTLAVGVGIAQLLEEIGVRGVGLKWPNDLIVRDGKLGGILTEVRTGFVTQPTVVVGIGLNVNFAAQSDAVKIESRIGRAIDLASCTDDVPTRNILSAMVIERLSHTLREFDASGFERYFAAWPKFDWLQGQQVSVDSTREKTAGTCQGIDVDGALLVQSAVARQRVISGSVQLHEQPGCID